MATEVFQAFDRSAAGNISAADVPTCRFVIGFRHEILSAKVVFHGLVTSNGTNLVQLRYADFGGSRSGAALSVELNNTTLANPATATRLQYLFDFMGYEALWADAPGDREYLVNLSTTSSSDRLDEPLLILEVRRL